MHVQIVAGVFVLRFEREEEQISAQVGQIDRGIDVQLGLRGILVDDEEEAVIEINAEAQIQAPAELEDHRGIGFEAQNRQTEIKGNREFQGLSGGRAEAEIPLDKVAGVACKALIYMHRRSQDAEAGEDLVQRVGDDLIAVLERAGQLLLEGLEDVGAQIVDELRGVVQIVADEREIQRAELLIDERLQLAEDKIETVDQQRQIVEQVEVQAAENIGQIGHLDIYAAGVAAEEVLDVADLEAEVAQEIGIGWEEDGQSRIERADERIDGDAQISEVEEAQTVVAGIGIVVVKVDLEFHRLVGGNVAVLVES